MERLRNELEINYQRALLLLPSLSTHDAEKVTALLREEMTLLEKFTVFQPYISDDFNLDASDHPDIIRALTDDREVLYAIFFRKFGNFMRSGSSEQILEYLRIYPGDIFNKYEPPVAALLDNEKAMSETLHGIAEIIRDTSVTVTEERQRLTIAFETLRDDENCTPAQNWALLSWWNLLDDPKINYLQTLIDLAPNGEEILSVDKDIFSVPGLITLQGHNDEELISYAHYREMQIEQGEPVRNITIEQMAFVIPILLRNNFTWADIFTPTIIIDILRYLILYLDTPYLAQWIAHYPEIYTIMSANVTEDGRALLDDYLLMHENQRIRDVVLNLDDEESLVRSVMSTVDKQTDKLRALNLE